MSNPIYNPDGTCSIGNKTYSVQGCISGDYREIPMYDPLQQAVLQPNLMKDVVNITDHRSIDKLISQIGMVARDRGKTTKTRVFYTLERDPNRSHVTKIGTAAAGLGGASVTVAISDANTSPNGGYTMPLAGYKALIKSSNGRTSQTVYISAVTPDGSGGFEITLDPINNEIIDLSGSATHNLFQMPMREYLKGDTDCKVTDRRFDAYPSMVKHFVQMYERSICIHQDQMNGYAFDKNLEIAEGINPMTGKSQWMVYIPELMNELAYDHHLQRSMITLNGERDTMTGMGIDGLIPTAEKGGKLNFTYDANAEISLFQQMRYIARKISKTNSPKDYMLIHDKEFGFDFQEAMAQFVTGWGGNYTMSLFGNTPSDFEYFKFKDFSHGGINFRGYEMDTFDDPNKTGFLYDGFGILVPSAPYLTADGDKVPPLEYYTLEGSDNTYDNYTWTDDKRKRGCRTLDIHKNMTLALAIHGICNMGIIKSDKC